MALPTSREQFREYCLRQLGKPVIDIDVNNEQLDDRIEDALQYYRDYHFDGTQKVFIKHELTELDITNEYITVPDSIAGIINIFDIGDSILTNNIFSFNYQFALNDMWGLRHAGSLTNYFLARQHVSLMEELLVGKQPIRYNRNINRVNIDMDWSVVKPGQFVIIEGYDTVDPDIFADVWKDRWLLRYATQLFKKQWGTNLKKFSGVELPGGITFNGQTIYDEADAKISELEQEMIDSYSLPVTDLMG